RAAAGRRTPLPPTAIPRRTARCRSPPRTACASGGRSRAPPAAPLASASRLEHRDEVERPVERARPEHEVACGDRGGEAVVEGLRDPERRVRPVPPGPQRELVRAQHPRVEEAEQLDVREDAL